MSTKADSTIGRPQLAAERRKVELRPQVDEEEQQQEVADAGQPRAHRLAVGGGREREPGEEGAGLLREARPLAERRETRAPGDGEEQQQFLRARHGADDRGST
jgi:hypothetical protein